MNCGHVDGTKPFLQGLGWMLCLKCANDALELAQKTVGCCKWCAEEKETSYLPGGCPEHKALWRMFE